MISHLKILPVFAQELLLWNKKINLTSITTPEEIAEKHFIDSLAIVSYLAPGAKILDMGTGAGFPGIPLKIALPDLEMTLIDASVKKISFVKHIIRVLGLKGIKAQHIRADDLSQRLTQSDKFEVVTCRAFSTLNDFLSLALPFLSAGGSALALKGNFPIDEINALGDAGANQQILFRNKHRLKMEAHTYQLPFSHGQRSLIRFTLE